MLCFSVLRLPFLDFASDSSDRIRATWPPLPRAQHLWIISTPSLVSFIFHLLLARMPYSPGGLVTRPSFVSCYPPKVGTACVFCERPLSFPPDSVDRCSCIFSCTWPRNCLESRGSSGPKLSSTERNAKWKGRLFLLMSRLSSWVLS